MNMPPASALVGRRILVTRPAAQAAQTATLIRSRGGEAVLFPCLAVQCLPEAIRTAAVLLADLAVDIAFTSANGVCCVAQALNPSERDLMGKHRLAAVGEKTAKAMAEHGWQASIVAATASQDGLIETYRHHALPRKLLLFRAEEGRDALPDWLQRQGVDVTTVHAYRTVCPDGDASAVIEALHQDAIDAVLLGSPKTVAHYLQRIGDATLAGRPVVVAISPEVARMAESLGLGVQVVAGNASFPSMLDALAQHYLTMPTE
jgi:uroporphyrinogen-III synthase